MMMVTYLRTYYGGQEKDVGKMLAKCWLDGGNEKDVGNDGNNDDGIM